MIKTMRNKCDSHHSCLVLRASSPSKSLSWSHPIQTTAVPQEKRFFWMLETLFNLTNMPFINFIYWLQDVDPGSRATWCGHSHLGSSPHSWAPWQWYARQDSSHTMTVHSEDQSQMGRHHTQCLYEVWKLKQVNTDTGMVKHSIAYCSCTCHRSVKVCVYPFLKV